MPADAHPDSTWLRRARPLLGTLVEIGLPAVPGLATATATATASASASASASTSTSTSTEMVAPSAQAALAAAWAAIEAVQTALSRFDPDSDIARFERLPVGASLLLRPASRRVLRAAQALHAASAGLFDVSLGSGPEGWRYHGGQLFKLKAGTRLDLGGIAKGHALDAAVQAMQQCGCADGWVNAGGDLRAFGAARVSLQLRDEQSGGVRHFGSLSQGAFATSRYAPDSRDRLYLAPSPTAAAGGAAGRADRHVSVAAPHALWADALTKVVAASANPAHPLLARLRAQAWVH